MPDERRQFRVLYRKFLGGLIDADLLAAGGNAGNLLAQFAALLAAFSFVLAIYSVPQYGLSRLPRHVLLVAAWGDQEFFIATTMAISGMFAVLSWNAIFPDRRDALVLGPLALRERTILWAKAAAMATALGIIVVCVNVFTGLSYPLLVIPPGAGMFGWLRGLAAYWLTMAMAGLFPFCALLAVQGVAAHLLPRRVFLRVSALLQMAAFFVILGVYFLTPPLATVAGLTAPGNQRLLSLLPSFWFLGLFQELNGPVNPVFHALAVRAAILSGIVFVLAGVTYALGWRRHMRRIVEEPDIVPAGRSRIFSRLVRLAIPNAFQRAMVLFTGRTIARSRQHRLLLAAWAGIAFAVSLAYVKNLVSGGMDVQWHAVSVQLLVGSVVLMLFMVMGMRAVFALPVALASNWIFRSTAIRRPAVYFASARLALYVFAAVPVWIASAILYFTLWPGRPAGEHLLLLGAGGVLLVESAMFRFRKIPFACSYLPGRSNMRVKLGGYAILFLALTDLGVRIEAWSLEKFARFAVLFGMVLVTALWSRRRTADFARGPSSGIQFEEVPQAKTMVLELSRDNPWVESDAYAGPTDMKPGLWQRVRPFVLDVFLLLLCGFVYEHAGQWNDHRRFPRQGRSVDIGGRSLNICCAGEGQPAVIFESDFAAAAVSWTAIQRRVATFTRACWYDRAGYGWSDPGPFPNHSDTAARDLHRLLNSAGIAAPYILVGHRFGAFHVRVFRGFWPSEVAGLVLVDPLNEDTTVSVHNHNESLRPAVILLARTLGFFGWWRLLEDNPGPPQGGLTSREWETASALLRQNKTVAARIGEPPMWVSGELARAAGGFGDIPVVVLSSGLPSPAWYTETHERKLQLHAQLARRSRRGTHATAENSRYMLPLEDPDAVVRAIHDVVVEVRNGRPKFRDNAHSGTFTPPAT